jgi:hypothetical protein
LEYSPYYLESILEILQKKLVTKIISSIDPAEAFFNEYSDNYKSEISIVESSRNGIHANIIIQMMEMFM